MDSKPDSGFLDLRGEAYSYVEEGPFPLIEPGKRKYIPSFKDQGRDVRSVGRSSRSMRQAVACMFGVGDLL